MKTDDAVRVETAGMVDVPEDGEALQFEIEELESRIAFVNVEGGYNCGCDGCGCDCGNTIIC